MNHICAEIHNYTRGLYIKYMFFVSCLIGKYAIPVGNQSIPLEELGKSGELNKLSRKNYQLTPIEQINLTQMITILNTYLNNIDTFHQKHVDTLSRIKSTEGLLLFYSAYLLHTVNALVDVYRTYFGFSVINRRTYTFPILPSVIGQDSALKLWTPELVYYGFETSNFFTEGLTTKPILKLKLLHQELLKHSTSKYPNITKNNDILNRLATTVNQLQSVFQKTVCVNALIPTSDKITIQPSVLHSKKDQASYDKLFCDGYKHFNKQNKSCNPTFRREFDDHVMIENYYHEITNKPHVKNSLTYYMEQCEQTEWMNKVNIINYQIRQDISKMSPIVIPHWLTTTQIVGLGQ